MPVTYEIDKPHCLIRTRCFGNLTFNEVLEHFQELAQDPDCPAHLDVLLDLDEVTSIPDPHQLRVVSDRIHGIRERVQFGACAIVTNRDALFGMTRMFSVYAEQRFRVVHVFRKMADAQLWLSSQQSPAGTDLQA